MLLDLQSLYYHTQPITPNIQMYGPSASSLNQPRINIKCIALEVIWTYVLIIYQSLCNLAF